MATLLLLAGCGRGRHRVLEVAYVSAPQAALRDQVAAIFNRVGNVKNGERVEVLDREKRFARVRTSTGIEGWIEQRFLVDQKTFDALQKLTADNQNDPVQAAESCAMTPTCTSLPVDSEHLYQLSVRAQRVSILSGTRRETTGAIPADEGDKKTRNRGSGRACPILEDWCSLRDSLGRIGSVLARMVDINVPLDIAQYAEGQRFVAFFL